MLLTRGHGTKQPTQRLAGPHRGSQYPVMGSFCPKGRGRGCPPPVRSRRKCPGRGRILLAARSAYHRTRSTPSGWHRQRARQPRDRSAPAPAAPSGGAGARQPGDEVDTASLGCCVVRPRSPQPQSGGTGATRPGDGVWTEVAGRHPAAPLLGGGRRGGGGSGWQGTTETTRLAAMTTTTADPDPERGHLRWAAAGSLTDYAVGSRGGNRR